MLVFQGAACWILRLSNARLARARTAAAAPLVEGLNLQLCLRAHELTAQLLSCHLHLLWAQVFVIFPLPATMGPLYIRQYCLNYVYLSPVIQKAHSCCFFILPVILNSSLQIINLKIAVSSLIAPRCWTLLKAFGTDAQPSFFFSSMIFSWFLGGILLHWWTRSSFMYPILPCTFCSMLFLWFSSSLLLHLIYLVFQ